MSSLKPEPRPALWFLHVMLPHSPWTPVERPAGRVAVPPLLRGYLRLGAWICGAPALDPDFNCADFFVLLSLAGMLFFVRLLISVGLASLPVVWKRTASAQGDASTICSASRMAGSLRAK